MDSRAKELIKQGDNLYSKRAPLLSLWQELNEHFYPERADYMVQRTLGTEFADHLTTSYPVLCRRELGSLISTMLRPSDQDWMQISVFRDDKLDNAGNRWLEWASKVQKRAMYDRAAKFVRATKQGDNDFVVTGQCVLSGELNAAKNSLLYRSWHLRDCAWSENNEGDVDRLHRKWMPTAIQAKQEFVNASIHPKMMDKYNRDPYAECNVRHIVIPSEDYDTGSGPDNKRFRSKYVSVFVDVDNEHVIQEMPSNTFIYIVPRWQTVSGSQYAFSPCTVAGLPDARLIQAITLVLLEAGEKSANPSMIATSDVVRSDVNLMAGGLTWVEKDYDERLGEALRPINQDFSGLGNAFELRGDTKQMLMEAFYLNKISLPPSGNGEMTAFETAQRIQEYVRNALPLFEPMEHDYNGAICEQTFQLLYDSGTFGSRDSLPQSLRGQDIVFKFESPLHQTVERQKGHSFAQAREMIAAAAQADPSAAAMMDVKVALRDALKGIGTPSAWVRSETDMEADAMAIQKQQQTQEMLMQAGQGAQVAEQAGKAMQAFQGQQAQ